MEVSTEPDTPFGWGFYNDPDLVWLGYDRWRQTGIKPRKSDLQDEDINWSKDLDIAFHLVQREEFLKKEQNGR